MPDAAAPHPPSRSTRLAGSIREAAGDIKLAHSVFALPFALLAAAMAFEPQPAPRRVAGVTALVVACMVLARTWAMLFNRIVDRDIDAQNPRTDRRAVASGRLAVRSARAIAGASALGFIAACAMFWVFFDNPWPIALSVPTLVWIAFYSLTKRFTWWCHVFLGGALAASPLAAALAVRPGAIADFPALWLLAGMVLLWVAGFDVIYALADRAFDRGAGLFSVPARFGVGGALWIARGLHVGAAACLTLVWAIDPRLAWLFGLGVVLTLGLLIAEHEVVRRRGEAGLDLAFFTINGIVSVLLGALGIADIAI